MNYSPGHIKPGIKKRIEKKDLVPVSECSLHKGKYDNGIKCSLLSHIQINGDIGLVRGYIEPHECVSNVISGNLDSTYDRNMFINVDHIPHVYADESKKSNMEIHIQGFKFYQVYITRFRSTDKFYFIAQISKNDIQKLNKIINKEETNGQKNLRLTEGRN